MSNGREDNLRTARESDEFPPGAADWPHGLDGVSRRAFLRVAGASLAVGLPLVGCKDRPDGEKIVPYVGGGNSPGPGVPGVPVVFSSAMPWGGHGVGVLVTSREGRPIKVDGNPDHPSSLGGTNVFVQASIWDLYDPARLGGPICAGTPMDWSAFWGELNAQVSGEGRKVRVLTGAVTSPTLAAQLAEFERRFPGGRWHAYEPLDAVNTRRGAVAAFGRAVDAVHDFGAARVVVSLDSDFMFDGPGSLRYARDFMGTRRVRTGRKEMSRLYVAEGAWSLTGSMADHRLVVRPSRIAAVAEALAAGLGAEGAVGATEGQAWVAAALADLRRNAGASLVVAGEAQPPEVHALAHAMNHALGNVGKTVRYIDPVEVACGRGDDRGLAALAKDLTAGRVDALLILGGDPAITGPADAGFGDALEAFTRRGGWSAHLERRPCRTSYLCRWALPEAHYLEAWGDVRGHDGTTSVIQPLIAPLSAGMAAIEVLERTFGGRRGGYEIIRGRYRERAGPGEFEPWWSRTLQLGVVEATAARTVDVGTPRVPARTARGNSEHTGLEVTFRPDPSTWDGRFAGNLWLQELPRPFTKLVWDNALMMSPATAAQLKVEFGDVLRLTVGERSLEGPTLAVPAMADGVIVAPLGYGVTPPAGVDGPVGFDAYPARTTGTPWIATDGVEVRRTGRTAQLVVTRSHHAMGTGSDGRPVGRGPDAMVTPRTPELERGTANRGLARVVSLEEFRANPSVVRDLGGRAEREPLLSLYVERELTGKYQWGMSIDQTACVGCQACVVACQAENNIAVVGRDQVSRQREMHWIRIDDHLGEGPAGEPRLVHQPVPCMHCEDAPCEYVCPVGATTHSFEGLNQMTYNRCVGTRYCSNNCPYKVRRFNFLDYAAFMRRPGDKLRNNPDVTVRARGVMEKCSYCVQRVERTRSAVARATVGLRDRAARTADADERQGLTDEANRREFNLIERLETACQQACPTRAITFGSVRPVAGQATPLMAEKAEPLDYALLRELTTRPRTTYLARVTNPSPMLAGERGGGA